jgi:hypothetical protein
MKKRIALADENEWVFYLSALEVYYNEKKVYPKVQELLFMGLGYEINGLEFDLSEISLPNLKQIFIFITEGIPKQIYLFINKLQDESFKNVNDLVFGDYNDKIELQHWISKCENLIEARFSSRQIDFLPADLSKTINLLQLNICQPKLNQIPDTIYLCQSLEILNFFDASQITVINDDIKNLTNLKSYLQEYTAFTYISPHLFKLPDLEELNFSFTSFENPPSEIFEAIKDLKQRKPHFKYSSQGGDWFREIWYQV